jgi:flagellar hook-basal body complex protein FliE
MINIAAAIPSLPATGAAGATSSGAAPAAGFGDALHRMLSAVDSTAASANDAVTNMLQGTGDVHTAMIALQQAETAMQLTVQVRNKFMQAYQDVMRMSI